ncbi:hypothetical protein [Nesterenkonia suensis]
MSTMPTPPPDGFPQSPPQGFPGATPQVPARTRPAHSPEPPARQPTARQPPTRQPWTRPEEELSAAQDPHGSADARARRHGDPALVRAWRTAARALVSDSFPDDYAQAVAACQQPVTTGRRIGVISPVGGAGRSSLVSAMGLLFSAVRFDHIAAADLAGRPSGLPARLPSVAEPATGIKHLATRDPGQTEDALGALADGSARVGGNLHRGTLLPHETHLAPQDLPRLHQLFSRSCAVSLLELPPLSSELAGPAMRDLHAVVLAVPAQSGAADGAQPVLEALREAAPVAPVVPALVNTTRAGARDRRLVGSALRSRLRAAGHPTEVHRIDADRHLAAGGPLTLSRIGERRRLQLARLTAAALDAAQGATP